MIKLKSMIRAGHVACMGRRGVHIGYWWESQKERDHYKALDIGGRIMFKKFKEELIS
jgi:hypothetical protein